MQRFAEEVVVGEWRDGESGVGLWNAFAAGG
jgi:hypothetical protein